jgi:signal peptidase I
MQKKDLRATWPQAFFSLLLPVVIILMVRWLLIEPFVIPSGSMIPTLLIHDHIAVNKLAFGIQWPFSEKPMLRWSQPKRGDIVVFRYPANPQVFYVKRILGLPGDRLSLSDKVLKVNGEAVQTAPLEERDDGDFEYFEENSYGKYAVRYLVESSADFEIETIPQGKYFVLGDNRDQSADSRSWGFLPGENIIGKAGFIWLSCDKMLSSAPNLCDPQSIRWNRLFQPVSSP